MTNVSYIRQSTHKIAYFDRGEGETVLFIHGSWDDHGSWENVIDSLSPHFRTVSYDRRGHSLSTEPPGQGSIYQDVEDVLSILGHLNLSRAHIVGHSYGACIAIALATAYPDHVASLYLHEPPLFALLTGSQELDALRLEAGRKMKQAAQLIEEGKIEEGALMFLEDVAFGKGSWQELFDAEAQKSLLANAHTWLDQFKDPDRLALSIDGLMTFPRRLTISMGTGSYPAYRHVCEHLLDALPSASKAIIKGGAHGAHISHPTEFATQLQAHLKESIGI